MGIRLLLVIVWGLLLVVLTCTISLKLLYYYQVVHFSFNPHPKWSKFYTMADITKVHKDWVIVKIGHYVGFGIMDLLLYNLFRKHSYAVVISFLLALATEIIQMYFQRDGRLYDLIIDTLGIATSFILIKLFLRIHSYKVNTNEGLEKM
jgi:VanZ family protein